jgi:hypothetical protein
VEAAQIRARARIGVTRRIEHRGVGRSRGGHETASTAAAAATRPILTRHTSGPCSR